MRSIADARQPFGSARIAGAYNPTLSDLLLLFHLLLLLFHLILLLFHLLLLFIPVGAYNLTLSDLLLLLLRLSSYQSIDTQPCSNSSPTFSNPLPHLFHSPFLVNLHFCTDAPIAASKAAKNHRVYVVLASDSIKAAYFGRRPPGIQAQKQCLALCWLLNGWSHKTAARDVLAAGQLGEKGYLLLCFDVGVLHNI